RLLDDLMGLPALDVGHKADSTGVLFKPRVIETLFGRISVRHKLICLAEGSTGSPSSGGLPCNGELYQFLRRFQTTSVVCLQPESQLGGALNHRVFVSKRPPDHLLPRVTVYELFQNPTPPDPD